MIETIDKICKQLPPEWEISLSMTSGKVKDGHGLSVDLIDPQGRYLSLPDASGKTIEEQLLDALYAAKTAIP